jgi:hypothetical protein
MARTREPRPLIPATQGSSQYVWSCQAGTIQTHPYQLLWQDARIGSHSGGGHAGHDESLFSGYPPIHPVPPANFLDVLCGWGQTWIWDDLKVTRGTNWIAQAIFKNSLVAVTDGSYIKEHYHNLCLAAFVLECMQGQGRAIGAFPEASAGANAYWGELLGLMAVHLLLLAVNTVSPGLSGRVKIYFNCLGALGRMAKLPPYHVPTQCWHSDILKTILVNCGGLSLHWESCHIKAHQDNHT